MALEGTASGIHLTMDTTSMDKTYAQTVRMCARVSRRAGAPDSLRTQLPIVQSHVRMPAYIPATFKRESPRFLRLELRGRVKIRGERDWAEALATGRRERDLRQQRQTTRPIFVRAVPSPPRLAILVPLSFSILHRQRHGAKQRFRYIPNHDLLTI